MKIAAIPTVYKDIQFRSRLEARWAAFFDLCGWDWEYEPIDLSGWIPDFVIYRTKSGWDEITRSEVKSRIGRAFVEVKPISNKSEPAFADAQRKAWSALGGLDQKEYEGILYVGLGPIDGDHPGMLSLGWYTASYHLQKTSLNLNLLKGRIPYAHSVVLLKNDESWDFASYNNESGTKEGELYYAFINDRIHDEASKLWRQAGNAVQYKAPKGQG